MPMKKPGLQRSRDQRILFGVCGGLAEWLGWNATLVRLLFFAVSVASAAFPGILVYVVLAILMPVRERESLEELLDLDAPHLARRRSRSAVG